MFKPGDVVAFYNEVAGKRKYHLCISLNGCFLFLNSPKLKMYPGDVEFDCAEFPFLPATQTGKSIVSCNTVLKFSNADLYAMKAQAVGAVKPALLRLLVAVIEESEILSDEEREAALDGLGDWI